MSREQIEFLKESHRDLKLIENDPFHMTIEEWKARLLPKLQGTSKNKISRLKIVYSNNSYTEPYIEEHEFKIAGTILKDTAFKYLNKKTKEDIEAIKILKAREENIDFDTEEGQQNAFDVIEDSVIILTESN